MKKSLLVSNFFPPEIGGIQNYLYNLITRLPEDKAAVLVPRQENAKLFDDQHNFPTYRKNFNSPLRHLKLTSLDLYLKTIRTAKKEKVDLLLAGNFYLPALTCYFTKKINKIPYYIFTYGTEVTELQNAPETKQKIAKKILTEAQGIITISDYLTEKLVAIGVSREKITKIYPGVDSGFFKPKNQEEARDTLVKTGLIASPPPGFSEYNVILSVGRLVERKGHDMVIQSLPAILRNYPKTIYLIAGDGPHKKILQDLVKKVGIENYVAFLGSPDNKIMPDLYNACDVFTMPSRTIKSSRDVEGFGIVYLEASACGKPIIAGQGGGVAEAILNQKTGLLVNSESPSELAQAFIQLLDNPHLAESLGKNGRKRVLQEFNWDTLVKKLIPLLK